MDYVHTGSRFSSWRDAYPGKTKRRDRGKGGVVDKMFDKMRIAEREWKDCKAWRSWMLR